MGNIRSEAKRRVRFNRKHANDLFLKFSLHDKLLAETVHTVDTEKIVAEKLAERFPDTSEVVFQSQILNHEYGEVLIGALQLVNLMAQAEPKHSIFQTVHYKI